MQFLVVARVVVNFISAVVQILVSNFSLERVSISKVKVIADDTVLQTRRVDMQEPSAPTNCVALVSTTDAGSAPSPDQMAEAMKNADKSLVPEQRGLLERLLLKHASVFAAAPQKWGASV